MSVNLYTLRTLRRGWMGIYPATLSTTRGQVFSYEKFLAEGEFGSVYLYADKASGARVALKITQEIDECRDSSFYFAECANLIQQRCLTGMRGVLGRLPSGREISFYAIAMEVMDEDLAGAFARLQWSGGAKKKVILAVHHAVVCLAEQRKYFTDLKPQNVMINWTSLDDHKEVQAQDLEDIKLVDLGSICPADHPEGGIATLPPPRTWGAFGGDRDFGNVPCTASTLLWQIAIFAVGVYLGEAYVRRFRWDMAPSNFNKPKALKLFADTRARITPGNFPGLPLTNLRDYFTDPLHPRFTRVRDLFVNVSELRRFIPKSNR